MDDAELINWFYEDTLKKVKTRGYNSLEEFISAKNKELKNKNLLK